MKLFRGNCQKLIFKFIEVILSKRSRITKKIIDFQRVCIGENPEQRFRFKVNDFFGQASEMGQILSKTILLHKLSNIQLN